MKRFVVTGTLLGDMCLKTEIVEASNAFRALLKHSFNTGADGEWIASCFDAYNIHEDSSLEEMLNACMDCDILMDVIELS